MGRDAKGCAKKAAAIWAMPSRRAWDNVATVAARMSRSDDAVAIAAAIWAWTALLSKMTDAGQIKLSGVLCADAGMRSEAWGAKTSWGLVKDYNLIVLKCSNGKAALVKAIWQQTEDT